jgi:putative acyl-CoA dehydrogenase
VICLDILRALQKDPLAKEVLFAQLQTARGGNAHLDRAMDGLPGVLAAATANEAQARRLAQQLALCLQGGLLVQHAPAGVADAFCASRFGPDGAGFFGTLPEGVDFDAILGRTMAGELA